MISTDFGDNGEHTAGRGPWKMQSPNCDCHCLHSNVQNIFWLTADLVYCMRFLSGTMTMSKDQLDPRQNKRRLLAIVVLSHKDLS